MASSPATTAVAPSPLRPAKRSIQPFRVTFTGVGAEYFRVWVVNVLLSIVTLSLYTPWARRRTAQYFYGHTFLAHSPLEFVAEIRRMVFGFLVYFSLYAAYELASYTEQKMATTLLAGGFAVLTPFVWGSAMRFRYRATRWRGIRLAFVASWKEVYLASWPVFVIAAMWVGLYFAIQAWAPPGTPPPEPATCPRPPLDKASALAQWLMQSASPATLYRLWSAESATPLWLGVALALLPAPLWAAIGLVLLLTLLCVIRLDFNYTRLRIARVRLGGHLGRWKLPYVAFVKVWLVAVAIFLLSLAAQIAIIVGVSLILHDSPWVDEYLNEGAQGFGWFALSILIMLATLVSVVLASLPARAWREARLFHLVWNHVGLGQIARTRSSLRTGPYIWLRFKNVVLAFLTLGFYRPFALTSEYAAKAESVTLYVKGDLDQLRGELVPEQGGIGDAAADAFGLDLIG